jgi:hypothetical protein
MGSGLENHTSPAAAPILNAAWPFTLGVVAIFTLKRRRPTA